MKSKKLSLLFGLFLVIILFVQLPSIRAQNTQNTQNANNSYSLGIVEDFNGQQNIPLTFGAGSWTAGDGLLTQQNTDKLATCYLGRNDWVNYTVETVGQVVGSNSDFGVMFRVQENTGDYYSFRASKVFGVLAVEKYSNGLRTVDHDIPYQLAVGDWYQLKVEVQGFLFSYYINGTEVSTWTDNSYVSGKVGLFTHQCSAVFDYFSVNAPFTSGGSHLNAGNTFNIMGTVYNASSLEPAANAEVSVNGTLVESDQNGFFNASVVSPEEAGRWTYVVQCGSSEQEFSIVTDMVIVAIQVPASPILIGSNINLKYNAYYAYEHSLFNGSVTLNMTIGSEDGRFYVTVERIEDPVLNLTSFRSNTVQVDVVGIKILSMSFYEWQLIAIGSEAVVLLVIFLKIKNANYGLRVASTVAIMSLFVGTIFLYTFIYASFCILLCLVYVLGRKIVLIEWYDSCLCPQCGQENPPDSSVCKYCGWQFERATGQIQFYNNKIEE